MNAQHPNVALLERLNVRDLQSRAASFAEDFVWHDVNRLLPDIQGDYLGVSGLQRFFEKMGRQQNLWVDFRSCELAQTYSRGNDAVGDK